MASERVFLEHGFGPFFDEESQILILGSFPSIKSREQGFFYGHPRNRFWAVLAAVYGSETPQTITEKKCFLRMNHIALYDVIERCSIVGSSDSSIRDVVPADLGPILQKGQIGSRIFTNGKKASSLYRRFLLPITGIPACDLPSTSPANAAMNLSLLTEFWRSALINATE